MLKVGDILICHTKLIMNGSGIRTTVGKSYKIVSISDNSFVIKNDFNRDHYIYINIYTQWFYTLKQYRKIKLEKIKEGLN